MSPIIRLNSGSLRMAGGNLTVAEGPVLPPGNPTMWWDFTDISVLFQDTAESVPVTADGQDVSSVTDKGTQGLPLIAQDAGLGAPNPPEYVTNVNNGHSGLDFDSSNTEALVSDTFDFAHTVAVLCIGIRPVVAPVGATLMLCEGPGGSEYLRFMDNPGNQQAISVDSKASQAQVAPVAGRVAAWALTNTTGGEVSLNNVAGTDEKTGVSPGNPPSGRCGVGSDNLAFSSFSDSIVLEVIWWDAAQTTLPTQAQMEAYATDKHLITWA